MSDDNQHAKDNARGWLDNIAQLVTALKKTEKLKSGKGYDEAREAIEESPLSVEVRSGWHAVGATPDEPAAEYCILLTTGGPALRIVGALDNGSPDEWPRLEWQDWGVPWTAYKLSGRQRDNVCAFASVFYFGD